MNMLDIKLARDLKRIWAQALAIALVVAAGIATMVLAIGAYRSLEETRSAYYERYRFADIFATVTRAPEALVWRISQIPGVITAEARIVKSALLDVEGQLEPATGVAISLPDRAAQKLNRLYLRAGRLPEPGQVEEVTVNEAFALAQNLKPGATFKAILNGKKRRLKIVGIALSPEYIYALGPGDLMPDDRRFAVMWMSRKALEALFDLDGAFNDVSLKLLPGASEPEAIARLDRLLARYGGTGAIGRKDKQSHAFLDAELKQLAAMAQVVPPIFLLVSAFLINMTLTRLVALEREQIGLLKALGYDRTTIAWHYTKLVLAIALLGMVIGIAAGTWLGRGLTRLYADFFHFPFLIFRRDFDVYALACSVSAAAAVLGALRAVGHILTLAPAVAMRPPAPPRYRRLFQNHRRRLQMVSQLTIMALRHIIRWPLRAAFTTLGIGLAVALLITALFTYDSVDFMIDVSFFRLNRQQATVTFVDEKHSRALQAVSRLPGVLRTEPMRSVAIRMRSGHRSRRLSIQGKPKAMSLNRVLDLDFAPVTLPEHGVVISERVAEVMRLKRGDHVRIDILEGRRGTKRVRISGIIKSFFGLQVYMDMKALNEMMNEGPRLSGIHISFDAAQEEALYTAIKNTPAIAAIALQRSSLQKFRETLAENINIMTSVYITLSVIIAFGVVYNSARIQLSERGRELASLRVLGFTKLEVSRVLVTELTILTALAMPAGWAIGHFFAWLTVQGFTNDLYSIPFIVERATYATASAIVLIASAVSILIVRRRIDNLDLIKVLKTRE